MRSTFSITALAGALLLGASAVMAQATTDQSQRCARTLKWTEYEPVLNYQYDDTAVFKGGITYDAVICTDPVVVQNLAVTLNDYVEGRVFRCTVLSQFAADSGKSSFECRRTTRGAMARATRDTGESEYTLSVVAGIDPDTFGPIYAFRVETVEETPAPAPSGTLNRRKATLEQQHRFDCPIGQTSCWTGERQEYACMDTSSDVTACGRCPYALGGADNTDSDCTSIEGADDVQCRNSRCLVNACQRGYKLSLDKTKCIQIRKRSITARAFHS